MAVVVVAITRGSALAVPGFPKHLSNLLLHDKEIVVFAEKIYNYCPPEFYRFGALGSLKSVFELMKFYDVVTGGDFFLFLYLKNMDWIKTHIFIKIKNALFYRAF